MGDLIRVSREALAEAWNPLYIVIDATGAGEGLWSMLHRLYPTRTLPVKFSQQSKSEIGCKFLGIVDTGRFQSLADDETVRTQYRLCQSEVLPGPARTLRWGVKDGTRGPDGLLVHDDHLLVDSLVAILEAQKWTVSTLPVVKQSRDVFDELRERDHLVASNGVHLGADSSKLNGIFFGRSPVRKRK